MLYESSINNFLKFSNIFCIGFIPSYSNFWYFMIIDFSIVVQLFKTVMLKLFTVIKSWEQTWRIEVKTLRLPISCIFR